MFKIPWKHTNINPTYDYYSIFAQEEPTRDINKNNETNVPTTIIFTSPIMDEVLNSGREDELLGWKFMIAEVI